MKLLIVESPTKARKIGPMLGNEWTVMASFGHIRDLPVRSLGVEVTGDFKPTYEISTKSQRAVSTLKRAVAVSSEVVLATDPDREGEAISWHLQQVLKLDNPQRAVFHEITQQAVTKALQSARYIDLALVSSQEGRRILDRLCGYLVSPAISNYTGQQLSAGRVQSVAVDFVVAREREISNFISTTHYGVKLYFDKDKPWEALWDTRNVLKQGERYVTDLEFVKKVAGLRDVVFMGNTEKIKTQSAPAPFITSTLQQAASIVLSMSPKETMQIAQKLFEDGKISYHRTDSPALSSAAVDAVRQWLANNNYAALVPNKPNVWKAKGNAQEAHEAIRPTNIDLQTLAKERDGKCRSLYQLIWSRTVASQMIAAKTLLTTLNLQSVEKIDGKYMLFKAVAEISVERGWKTLRKSERSEPQADLPQLNKGQTYTARDSKLIEKKTTPPPRYTEASLIKKLEAEGVGRPSTYASILENVKRRSYVLIKKQKLYATETGCTVVDTLTGRFEFIKSDFTKNMEEKLDKIALGEMQYSEVVKSVFNDLTAEVSRMLGTTGTVVDKKCPACGKAMRQMPGKYGRFWGCSGYPECKTTAALEGTKKELVSVKPCPACGKGLVKRKGKQGDFLGCGTYPECKHTESLTGDRGQEYRVKKTVSRKSATRNTTAGKTESIKKCPSCNAGSIVKRKIKNGKNKGQYFNGCTSFPDCKHFEWAK